MNTATKAAWEEELLANCEECGKPISADYSLCDACRPNEFDTAEEAGGR